MNLLFFIVVIIKLSIKYSWTSYLSCLDGVCSFRYSWCLSAWYFKDAIIQSLPWWGFFSKKKKKFLFFHSTKIFDKYIDNKILNNFHLFIFLITQLHIHIILFTRQSVEVILIFYANFFCTNMNLSHANFFFTQFSCQFYRVILILIGTIIFTKYFYYLLI